MRKPVLASTTIVVLAAACSIREPSTRSDAVSAPVATFLHAGYGAGPVVFTDAGGHVLEERRYEPFGTPVDARVHGVSGGPDLVARDLNPLNKRTDAATGWSDHGARWLAPETGRWQSPDPIVVGPDANFMAMPWALHPYQYVHQNPVAFWDPDGRCSAPTLGPGQVGICIEAYIARSSVITMPIPLLDPEFGGDSPTAHIGIGKGDNRGPSGTDASLTAKIQQQITLDLQTGKIVNTTMIANSQALHITRRASGSSVLGDFDVDAARNISFTAGGHAVNGFSSLPGGPAGSIDYRFRFTIDAHGDAMLDWGVHKGFPSYSAYAYKHDASGKLRTQTLHESRERALEDLTVMFNGVDPFEIMNGLQPTKRGSVNTLTTKDPH